MKECVIGLNILFLTDTHIRGTSPKNRKDNIIDTLEGKLKEVIELVDKHDIDYILHGGDFFDRPDISISIASRFAKILKGIKVPIYTICGNHDVYGHNPDTVNRSVLGLFDAINLVNILDTGDKVLLEKDGVSVQITGQPYTYDIDSEGDKDKYMAKRIDTSADYAIHMAHGMLLDRPFIKGIPYTLVDDIKNTKADITLAGHYHTGFGILEIDNKYFVNPGSFVRITNSLDEIKRIPKVVLIKITDDIDIQLVSLETALPGKEVLDRKEIESNMFKNEQLTEFKRSIDGAVGFDKLDINQILIDISNTEDVSEKVKEEALNRIASSQAKIRR